MVDAYIQLIQHIQDLGNMLPAGPCGDAFRDEFWQGFWPAFWDGLNG